MVNIKNRDCVAIHFQIQSENAELIEKLYDRIKANCDSSVFKYEVLDFIIWFFRDSVNSMTEVEIIDAFSEFQKNGSLREEKF